MRKSDHCVRPGRNVLVEPQACNEGERGSIVGRAVARWDLSGVRRVRYI